mmetsp:Transcript_13190/g.29937  ORF Transcript_13190/g.29937 Transcript_13190/m.29937 type:complete len:293 (+) Transcript_13190:926-1804(+)
MRPLRARVVRRGQVGHVHAVLLEVLLLRLHEVGAAVLWLGLVVLQQAHAPRVGQLGLMQHPLLHLDLVAELRAVQGRRLRLRHHGLLVLCRGPNVLAPMLADVGVVVAVVLQLRDVALVEGLALLARQLLRQARGVGEVVEGRLGVLHAARPLVECTEVLVVELAEVALDQQLGAGALVRLRIGEGGVGRLAGLVLLLVGNLKLVLLLLVGLRAGRLQLHLLLGDPELLQIRLARARPLQHRRARLGDALVLPHRAALALACAGLGAGCEREEREAEEQALGVRHHVRYTER